eukprot:2430562-Amphidinium_carterae.1
MRGARAILKHVMCATIKIRQLVGNVGAGIRQGTLFHLSDDYRLFRFLPPPVEWTRPEGVKSRFHSHFPVLKHTQSAHVSPLLVQLPYRGL